MGFSKFRERGLAFIKRENEKKAAAEKARAERVRAKEKRDTVDLSGISDEVIQAVRNLSRAGSRGKKSAPDRDYVSLVKEAMQQYGCDVYAAMAKVNKAVPMAKEDYIEAANRQSDPDGPQYSQEEIETYKTQVDQYMVRNKCSRLEATRDLDILKPGLRDAWVRYR